MLHLLVLSALLAGPPQPLPWRDIPDPADDAERRIAIMKQDRGPVWLYTGILNGWHPDQTMELLGRIRPRHWRGGLWPHWYPRDITVAPRAKWLDKRDSPVYWAQRFDTMMKLRETGMTWQVLLHHKGPYYNKLRIQKHELEDFYQHIHLLARYLDHMGLPVDYWEICNEPGTGPYEGIAGYNFRGTWQEFLDHWDTAYRAIRDAVPDARIVGPSYGTCNVKSIEPFLQHAAGRGQIINALSWHEISQSPVLFGQDYEGPNIVQPDKAHKNIHEIRTLVETKYPQLGVEEIHIDEWGYTIQETGPGTQMAFFYYFDQAGIDRAAKSHWTQEDLDGILVDPQTPRASYWCWAEYAKQDGGIRLVTDTNDRHVIALASRHDGERTLRAIVARSKRDTGADKGRSRPPVKTVVAIEGIPLEQAEIVVTTLGPHDGPVWEEDLGGMTTVREQRIVGGRLTLTFDEHREHQVHAVTIAPVGTHARAQQQRATATPTRAPQSTGSRKAQHMDATARAQQAAARGLVRISCGADLAHVDADGRAWFADRMYRAGSFGWTNAGAGTVDRGDDVDIAPLYRTELWGVTGYRVTVPDGAYRARLHFAETYGVERRYDVLLEGKIVLPDLNPLKAAGAKNVGFVREFDVTVSDGVLDIGFVDKATSTPMINGIELIRHE